MRDHNIYLIDLPLLIVLVSLVYSATRYDEWGPILHEAVRWGARLVAFLGAIAVLIYAVTVGGLAGIGIAAALLAVVVLFYWLTRGR